MEYIIYVIIGLFVFLIFYGVCFVNYSFQKFKNASLKYSHNQVDTMKTNSFIESVSKKYFHGRLKLKIKKEKYLDCFKPGLFLMEISEEVAFSSSIYAYSVVSHEMGHALQLYRQPNKMAKYLKQIRASKFLSNIIWPLIIGAIVLFFLKPEMSIISLSLLGFAVLCFFISLATKLKTTKFEWEASEYGLELLARDAEFDDFQLNIAKELLVYAKNTYLADFWRSCLKWTLLVR